MNTDNKYLRQFNKIINGFETTTKTEITKAIIQSIDDLDLMDSNFNLISDKLGTPQEFVDEYLKELNIESETSLLDIGRPYNKLEFSFIVIKMMQILAVIIIPLNVTSYRINESEMNIENIENVIIQYTISIIIFIISYIISRQRATKVQNFGSYYFNIFKVLILFIFINLVMDDYFLGLDQFANENVTFLELKAFGSFVFWIVPVMLLSGLKFTMIKENLIIPDNNQLSKYRDKFFKKAVMDTARVLIVLGYIMIYFFKEATILYQWMKFLTLVIIFEYLIVYRNHQNYFKRQLWEILKVNIILVLIYLASTWLYNTIWGNF